MHHVRDMYMHCNFHDGNNHTDLQHITSCCYYLCLLQFLAFRLSEVKLSNELLTADLNTTMVSRHLADARHV